MREKAALYLLIFSLILIIGIDVTPYLIHSPSPLFSYLESAVDAAVVVLTYILLKRELNFRTRVLRIVAHDLRNPIGQIRGFSELVLEHDKAPAEDLGMIRRIHVKSNEVLQLVNDLLDSSVLERRQVRLAMTPVSLNLLAAEVTAEFEIEARRKNQNLLFQASTEVEVKIDPARMKQVFANLISNAVKYSPPGAPITVVVEKIASHGRICVSDRGPGLTSTECTRIFQSFTDVKKATTGGEPSTGLGLSIAKSLVELQGGRIWAESGGPGQGADFYVELPVHT